MTSTTNSNHKSGHQYKALELEQPGVYELEGLEVGVTSNCNFKCDYCCAYRRNDGQCIDADEVIRIIQDLPKLRRVRLSGGEVTLKFEDCVRIVDYCTTHGIATQLNSNASVLSRERIRRLKQAGLSNIHISFNFTEASAFARYYGMPESIYDRVVHNIHLCVEEGLETVLETLLFAGTQHRMTEISQRVYDLGVRIHEIQNSIKMEHTCWEHISTADTITSAFHDLVAWRPHDMELYFTCIDRFATRLGLHEQPGVHFSNCVDGKKQLHLHGNGDILICELCHPVVIGNIYEGTDLKSIYTNRPPALATFLNELPCPAYDALFATR